MLDSNGDNPCPLAVSHPTDYTRQFHDKEFTEICHKQHHLLPLLAAFNMATKDYAVPERAQVYEGAD